MQLLCLNIIVSHLIKHSVLSRYTLPSLLIKGTLFVNEFFKLLYRSRTSMVISFYKINKIRNISTKNNKLLQLSFSPTSDSNSKQRPSSHVKDARGKTGDNIGRLNIVSPWAAIWTFSSGCVFTRVCQASQLKT